MRAALADVEAVYRSRLAALCRVAAAVSGDRQAAPDIVQEAFARAVRELAGFRGDSALEAWLWRIVVNTARNHRRSLRPTSELSEDTAAATNGSAAGTIAGAIAALPERQRLVLFLRYYADLDYSSIAQALDISVGTVGATLNAGRAALQQLLMKQEVA
jgi:RNA polymerase sigma-70 factor, ECF subfamily